MPKSKFPTETERQAFEIFAAKRPVDMPGPQATAERMKRVFWHLLTIEEQSMLLIAWSHAVGCGREPGRKEHGYGEHDIWCQKVRERWNGV